jgi:hypothetical protein
MMSFSLNVFSEELRQKITDEKERIRLIDAFNVYNESQKSGIFTYTLKFKAVYLGDTEIQMTSEQTHELMEKLLSEKKESTIEHVLDLLTPYLRKESPLIDKDEKFPFERCFGNGTVYFDGKNLKQEKYYGKKYNDKLIWTCLYLDDLVIHKPASINQIYIYNSTDFHQSPEDLKFFCYYPTPLTENEKIEVFSLQGEKYLFCKKVEGGYERQVITEKNYFLSSNIITMADSKIPIIQNYMFDHFQIDGGYTFPRLHIEIHYENGKVSNFFLKQIDSVIVNHQLPEKLFQMAAKKEMQVFDKRGGDPPVYIKLTQNCENILNEISENQTLLKVDPKNNHFVDIESIKGRNFGVFRIVLTLLGFIFIIVSVCCQLYEKFFKKTF